MVIHHGCDDVSCKWSIEAKFLKNTNGSFKYLAQEHNGRSDPGLRSNPDHSIHNPAH